MNKKLFFLFGAVVLAVILFVLFLPKPLLSADAEVYAVYLNGEDIDADMEEICAVLKDAKAVLTLKS